MQRINFRLYFTLMLMSLAFSAPLTAEKKNKDDNGSAANLPEVIWRDRGDVASLNLFYGAGDKNMRRTRRASSSSSRKTRKERAQSLK